MKLDSLFASLVPAAAAVVAGNIMAEARALANENNKKKILGVAVDQFGVLETAKQQQVANVREYRQAFKTALKKLEKLDTAMKYAEETGNFVPAVYINQGMVGVRRLASSLGCECPAEKDSILNVPSGWKPKAE